MEIDNLYSAFLTSPKCEGTVTGKDSHGHCYIAFENGTFQVTDDTTSKTSLVEVTRKIKKCVTETQALNYEKSRILHQNLMDLKGRVVEAQNSRILYRILSYIPYFQDKFKTAISSLNEAIAHLETLSAASCKSLEKAPVDEVKRAMRENIELNEQQALKFAFGFAGSKLDVKNLASQAGVSFEQAGNLLEGGNPESNMRYLISELNQCFKSGEFLNPPDLLLKMTRLRNDLIRSVAISQKFNKWIESSYKDENLEALRKTVDEALESLPIGGRIIIPSGTSSHTTYLVFHKIDKNQVQPILYNTGEGIERHETLFDPLTGTISPTLIYPNLSIDSNQKGLKISGLVVSLMNIVEESRKNVGNVDYMKNMYNKLEDRLGEPTEGAKRRLNLDSGVCSFAALSEICKDTLGSRSFYMRFKHKLLTDIAKKLPTGNSDRGKLGQVLKKML